VEVKPGDSSSSRRQPDTDLGRQEGRRASSLLTEPYSVESHKQENFGENGRALSWENSESVFKREGRGKVGVPNRVQVTDEERWLRENGESIF